MSLLPSATEIVFALGLGERLVGVTHECDFPAEARMKPVLTTSALPSAVAAGEIDRHVRASVHAGSSLYALDSELLERLAPDLILTQELCAVCAVSYDIVARAARRLRGDPRIVSLEPASLEDLYANVTTIGERTGVPEAARSLIGALRTRTAALAGAVAGLNRPRTLLLEWSDPPMSAGHWIPELIELAGGVPVLANPRANSTTLAWDAIAAADPDVILVAPCGFDLAATRTAVARLAEGERAWGALRAVREGRAYALDGNAYVSRPGPRLVDTAEIFARILHGTAFAAGPLATNVPPPYCRVR
ncbi:MAG: cobalamin-binding protein [Candidatus Baltobacteraceae bacterium]